MVHDLDDDGPSGDRKVSYAYDRNGNLRSTADSLITTGEPANLPEELANRLYTFTYDERDRVDSVTAYDVPGDPVLASGYDAFGNRDSLVLDPTGENLVHEWTFNKLDRLIDASFPGGASPTLAFSYLGNDDLDTLTHGNGLVTDYSYHSAGAIASITVGAAPLHKLEYEIDAVLNVKTIDETMNGGDAVSPAYDYAYDAVYRLVGADYASGYGLTSEPFPYDDAGNRDDDPASSTPWDYDDNNRVLASPGVTYTPDADGNLATRTEGGTTRSFTFDATNRLQKIEEGSTTLAEYRYDPFGRRIRKTTGGSTTHYLWDGDRLLAEYDGTGNRKVRYAYAGGFAPAQVAIADGGSGEDVYDVHTDHLDTPRMLTDASGAAVWRAHYEAFGRAHVSDDPDGNPVTPDPGIVFNIRFPGQYYDTETGLHYNRFRYYDPSIGRYTSADPIGQTSDLNVYAYAGSMPSRLIDPRGLILEFGGRSPEERSRVESAVDEARQYFADHDVDDPFDELDRSEETYTIWSTDGDDQYDHVGRNIHWNPNSGRGPAVACGELNSPALGLLHEGEHARAHDRNPGAYYTRRNDPTSDPARWTNAEERRVIEGPETDAAIATGEPVRDSHSGRPVPVGCPTCRSPSTP